MPLTASEKAAGKHFRDQEQAALANLAPPDLTVPGVLAVVRHQCAARQGRTTSIVLKEIYRASPAYDVFGTGGPVVVIEAQELSAPDWMSDSQVHDRVPVGRFGFIYRAGTCRGCGKTVRSSGRIVDGWARAPLQARARRTTMTDPTGGAETPETQSQPGPTYPHPEGINDPVSPEEKEESKPDRLK